MVQSKHRWLLEYDSDNEVYTESTTSDKLIARDLARFDNEHTFYCALFDNTDEACLWCFGEPDHRFIEIRFEAGHAVLRHKNTTNRECKVQHSPSKSDTQLILGAEIMTYDDALEIFLSFFHERKIPDRFSYTPKAYLMA